jgi:hypothetical protein
VIREAANAKLLGGAFLLLIALVMLSWIVVPVPDEARQAAQKKASEPEGIPRKSGHY